MVTMNEMVQAVKDHATEHYNDGGWDVIIETMDTIQIEEVLRGQHRKGWRPSRSVKGAIERFAAIAATYAEADAPHKAEREAAREVPAPEPEETAKERKARLARERRAAQKVAA